MSRSNNTDIVSPATRYFEWSGSEKGKGVLSYWDKERGEKGERVTVSLPFKFLVLDRVAQVGGGIGKGKDYQGFWSNAVRDTRVESFTVKSKQGVYATGLWKEIKDQYTKFITGLYIAYYDDEKVLQLGYLKMEGSANSAWIDFTQKQRDIYKGAFAITGSLLDESGSVTFYSPVFKWSENISDEANEMALYIDAEVLQPYLKSYFARPTDEYPVHENTPANEGNRQLYSGMDEPEMPPTNLDAEPPEDFDDSVPF